MRSKDAGSSPGYGVGSPFGHLLRFRTAQVPRCRLRFPALLSRLGGGRLNPSFGAGWIASSLFAICRLWSNRMWLWRLWQIHDRGSLNPSSGYGGNVKGYAPEGGS
jgi:hypothetical protein